jgi:pimeloyl-CoA synthetase
MFNIFKKSNKDNDCCNVKIEEVKEDKKSCCNVKIEEVVESEEDKNSKLNASSSCCSSKTE